MKTEIDVVISGAGPVGLLTAIELALGGVRVVVLERLAAASLEMKAGGLGPLGLEALQRRGMATAIAAAETRSFAAMAQAGADPRAKGSKYSGHFAGLSLIRKDAQKEPERHSRPVDQQALEAMLADRAHTLGIDVRRACEVTRFVQQADGVDVEWTSPAGEGLIHCAYLVGCDGGRSFVRKMAGFDFPGTPPTSTFYQAIAQIDHPERLAPMGWRRTSGGIFSHGPFPGRLVMIEFAGPPEDRQVPVTREEIEDVLRRVSGADVRVKTLESGSRWTDNTRLVDTYRKGRVLLAGDAAHIHTPLGGHGLSLGLPDAVNLGWKLAAVIRGEMPESLLDTYTAERRPVAEAVLTNTLAQMAIMRPDPQAGAMRDIIANLMQFDDVNRFIGEIMSGLSVRYDLGSESDDAGRLIGNRPISHGDDGISLYDLMQEGMGVLLDATGGKASKLVAATTQRVRCMTVDTGPSLLIRPDACIAWAGKENSTDGLEEALRRWFIPTPDNGAMV
ncbi:FAD-dependent monooxygenase [Phyllobacterium myrsinacearum]|uniref:2-polyprenyl-6-methoxyphenol hydroxylase-like FAD-dependent oxidoreductase n=1 Tax=Phyllobacterium myrsinacearum TaxID=28101 RepID=A0A839ECU1_9HYPH|nr:FAD-dependent monooxygenase [Phyllobacterium myrsinacearum]MBA8876519.1 2-polyprenyl-6-methoxyphenol hydroxylase-like FAD-dependent oxidoreductase [Phyllobacterium myrsinacearum]